MGKLVTAVFFSFLIFTGMVQGSLRTAPWLTEEAIEFLDHYLTCNPNARILEFGSGASTLWFATRTPNLYSIEHHPDYYKLISKTLEGEAYYSVHYNQIPLPYYEACDTFPDNFFDLILVDGRNRKGCIVHAIPKLKPGGILMLDNAERKFYHAVFPLMSEWEYFSTEQTGPDAFGFWYNGWKTDWWIKP